MPRAVHHDAKSIKKVLSDTDAKGLPRGGVIFNGEIIHKADDSPTEAEIAASRKQPVPAPAAATADPAVAKAIADRDAQIATLTAQLAEAKKVAGK